MSPSRKTPGHAATVFLTTGRLMNSSAESLRQRAVSKLKGKFVLSLNDVAQVRAIFKRFHVTGIETAYTAQKIAGRRYRELLITNF